MSLRLSLVNEAGTPKLTRDLLHSLVESLRNGEPAQVVILEGRDGVFCEGLDLGLLVTRESANDGQAAEQISEQYRALLESIIRAPRPVVALVDGPALGGGVGIAAACDLVLASPRANFALPESLLGLIPAHAFPVIAHRIGVPRARLLSLGGRPLTAEEALKVGLVDEVTQDLEDAVAKHQTRFSRMDPRAVERVKELVAKHFAQLDNYSFDATTTFAAFIASEGTRARIRRFESGEAPWPEEMDG